MEDSYIAPIVEAPPKGARLVHLSQLQNALTHMRTCLECQRAPKSVPSIVSEQIIGYASVLRLPCGQSMSTSPIVEPCTIIRDDALFQLAQQQLLCNASTLDELARAHGRYSSLDPPAPADGLMDMLIMQPASHTSEDAPTDTRIVPLEEAPAHVEAAGADNENCALAEVSALLLQLALTHYVGGTDATATTRTLLEVADMPSPPTFSPSSTFSGLLVARACILATMEAQRLAAGNYGGHGEAVDHDAHTGAGKAPPSSSKFRGVYKYKVCLFVQRT